MAMEWIESRDDLRCPTCGARLVEHVGRFDVLERPDPIYATDGSELPVCPNGHQLPANLDELRPPN